MELCHLFRGNFQVKMLSGGCHGFDVSFLFLSNHPHSVVGLEMGTSGVEPSLDLEIFFAVVKGGWHFRE